MAASGMVTPEGNIEKIITLPLNGQITVSYNLDHDDSWLNSTGGISLVVKKPTGENTGNNLGVYDHKPSGRQLIGGQIGGQPILGMGKLLVMDPANGVHQEGRFELLSPNEVAVSSLDGQNRVVYQLIAPLWQAGDSVEVVFQANKNSGANINMLTVETRPTPQAAS